MRSNFKVTRLFMIFSEKWHFCKMMKTTFLKVSWFCKMYVCYNLRDTYLKMKCYVLVCIKIYGGKINLYTMYTLCIHYRFPKNNQNYKFCKIVIFDQNWKCRKNVWNTILLKTIYSLFEKHWMHSSIHRNSRRKTLCLIYFT